MFVMCCEGMIKMHLFARLGSELVKISLVILFCFRLNSGESVYKWVGTNSFIKNKKRAVYYMLDATND